mmetsp:Transcript_1709/g.2257  ORF Transcript_1709/g.2257 Transcript_1709/m.2257 type:complete len:210 (+) Transcript_1709:571-1200(+)
MSLSLNQILGILLYHSFLIGEYFVLILLLPLFSMHQFHYLNFHLLILMPNLLLLLYVVLLLLKVNTKVVKIMNKKFNTPVSMIFMVFISWKILIKLRRAPFRSRLANVLILFPHDMGVCLILINLLVPILFKILSLLVLFKLILFVLLFVRHGLSILPSFLGSLSTVIHQYPRPDLIIHHYHQQFRFIHPSLYHPHLTEHLISLRSIEH